MALAEANHHSAPRRQTTARAEAANNALRSQRNSVAVDTELFSLYEDELEETRPDRLAGVRPKERVSQQTLEQMVDSLPGLSILDAPVPPFSRSSKGRLLKCPRSFFTTRFRSAPRLGTLSWRNNWWKCLLCVSVHLAAACQQNVDIPVPGARGWLHEGGLQGFSPGQGSTAFCRGGGPGGGLQNSVPGVQQRFAVMEDLLEVFKTLSQDRVQRRFAEVEDLLEVFKTLSQDRVRWR